MISVKNTIQVRPVKATKKVFSFLEKRQLIRMLRPTRSALEPGRVRGGKIDVIYESSLRHGSHKLICIGKNETEILFTAHPGNEELILVNATDRTYKPLYLVLGLHRKRKFESQAGQGRLSARDVMAVKLEYNGPLSVFTVLADTPHCEVTLPGKGSHPVFFVAEPTKLPMEFVTTYGYRFSLARAKGRER